MTIQTTGPNGILYKLVERALIEAHRNDLVKFNIVNTEKLKQEFRDALKKDYDIKDIDESDILFCFEEVDQNEVEQKDNNQKEDDGEVQDTGSEEENNDDSEVSDDSDTDNSKDNTEEQTDDTESSENDTEDDSQGEEDTGSDEESDNDSEPTFGITGDDNKEDDSQEDDSEEDDEEDETVKAVKEAIMKEEEESEKDQGEEESDQDQDEQGDEIENATEKDKDDAEGTTMGSSKTKENVVKAVARALYIDNPDDIQMFDINYQNKRCFFIKANIRK